MSFLNYVVDKYKRFNLSYYFNQWRWYSIYRHHSAPDGLPIPPPRLVSLVTGYPDLVYFYQNGQVGAQSIRAILHRNGLDINQFATILDFGCGCGRVLRHWRELSGVRVYGSDYNPELVGWSRQALDFAEFSINGLSPQLGYASASFEFIYVYSVFTHLPENLQRPWLDELQRILRPGGVLFVTVHGSSRYHQLTTAEAARFDAGQLVVRQQQLPGTNICSAFHPDVYMRHTLAQELTILDFVPAGARDAQQDVYLLQKPK